jgi:acylphosphatase
MSDEASQLRAFRITGRVQGVFFRVWTRDAALEMGLRGMVRNHNDGSVEAWARGPPKALDAFELRLWEGPADRKGRKGGKRRALGYHSGRWLSDSLLSLSALGQAPSRHQTRKGK